MEIADVMQRQKDRREAKRLSAQMRYHKKRQLIEQLREEAAQLEKQYSTKRLFLRHSHPSHDAGATTIEALRRQNAGLRKRLQRFLDWGMPPGPAAGTTRPTPGKAESAPHQPQDTTEVYSEIETFSASGKEGSISTGASVFGWTDQRRVDNGLLKFSLRKLNTRMSPEEASAALWALSASPDSHSKLNSQSMNMRSKVVQVVDQSNLVIWEEYQVHSNAGGVATATIVRSLVLLTLFATENGYILLAYGLDPELAAYPSNDFLSPLLDDNTIVKYAWQPVFCWTSLERVEGVPDQCLSSFVGTFPVEGANFVHWAVEVLLMVLRAESILLGPQWTLPQEEES